MLLVRSVGQQVEAAWMIAQLRVAALASSAAVSGARRAGKPAPLVKPAACGGDVLTLGYPL